MRHLYVTAMAAAALMASAMTANASCGSSGNTAHAAPDVKLPQILLQKSTSPNAGSITGMWHVSYLVGGNPAFQSFQQWHSDGTEFEFADIPTIPGDICMGVWSRKGRKYELYHTAWTFDSSGNPNGTMVLTHSDKISRDGNSFAGVFDLKFFDVDGNLVNELAGDTAADRIPAP